ncbi:ABC transporter permease [Marivirga sp.]|uniref:ABC transporter permease n=1 Tax=Marivirga sp. TaxID=2018662 RepID=UPI0025EA7EB3|nr:ABC transporter permease [Marivirga sp.]
MVKEKIQDKEQWDIEIKPETSAISLNFKELWRYRDLLLMFVKRDVITVYKQTILGPVWFVLQPILTTAIYVLVFGNIAKISTDGLPKVLFYLSGIVIWGYFAESFNKTSNTFKENEGIFGKVYFPRLITPLSQITSGLLKFVIQFLFFLAVYSYFLIIGTPIEPNYYVILIPLLIVLMGFLGLGSGIIFTSLTAKYRDLKFLITFAVQLLMYATPVIYPLSSVPEQYKIFLLMNPITPIVETFRFALLGTGQFSWLYLAYSFLFTVVVLFFGIIIFNRTERNFMDTV